MGFVELLVFIGFVLGFAWIAVWIFGYFLSGHPVIVDKLIWGVAIVIIVMKLAAALGLSGVDPQIPQF